MKEKELAALLDQELLQEAKKIKSSSIAAAILLGIMVGIAVFSTVKKGVGLFTFFPLFFLPIAISNGRN